MGYNILQGFGGSNWSGLVSLASGNHCGYGQQRWGNGGDMGDGVAHSGLYTMPDGSRQWLSNGYGHDAQPWRGGGDHHQCNTPPAWMPSHGYGHGNNFNLQLNNPIGVAQDLVHGITNLFHRDTPPPQQQYTQQPYPQQQQYPQQHQYPQQQPYAHPAPADMPPDPRTIRSNQEVRAQAVDEAPPAAHGHAGHSPYNPAHTTPSAARAAVGDHAQVQEAQAILEKLGFETQGGARQAEIDRLAPNQIRASQMDGVDGALTSAALMEVQKLKGLQQTGDVNPDTLNALKGMNTQELAAFKQQVQADVSRAPQGAPNVPHMKPATAVHAHVN